MAGCVFLNDKTVCAALTGTSHRPRRGFFGFGEVSFLPILCERSGRARRARLFAHVCDVFDKLLREPLTKQKHGFEKIATLPDPADCRVWFEVQPSRIVCLDSFV